ncbi:MAG: glycine--tRNA ligase beta subunit [Acidobacteriota bacterium]
MAEGELLLEVRAEEIPARMLGPAGRELATRLFEQLVALALTPHEVEAGSTPRRLWVVLTGLPACEKDRETIEVGPPASAAFDASGAPTAAAEGFARKVGVEVAALRRRVFTKADVARTGVKAEGERVYVERVVRGRDTREVLAALIPRTLAELGWAKTMRWGSGTGPWVRPVHGVVALFDGEIVPFELFGVASGRTTAGHPTLSPERFDVLSAADWRGRLGGLGIVPEPEVRRERLVAGMRERAAAAGGRLVEDGALLDKLAAICEIPGVLEGSFDAALLELPREVLRTSLADHQSALVVERPDGRLAPLFLTVMDRPDDPAGRVRAGNEWVVAARLADAAFFWKKDRSAPLEAGVERLEDLSFHERLGHYGSKRSRLDSMTSHWAKWAMLGEEEARHLRRAVQLLKVDLTSEMVREFTSLQGIVGGIYAREDGEADVVWQAIYDQYLPAGADDPLPRGRVGRFAALADRIDTLVGFFGLGLIPTGSKDPYGLRRSALGIVRLLLEGGIPLGLERVTRSAYQQHVSLKLGEDECWSKLRPFYEDRVRYLLGLRGFAHDEIEAGLGATGSPLESLPELERRVRAIHEVRDRPELLSVVLSFKRLNNILKDAADGSLPAEPDSSKLGSAAEQALVEARGALDRELASAAGAGDPARSLEAIGRFAEPLDRFFVEVLVMDPDPEVRRQRLALLAAVRRSIAAVADLSAVVVDKAELRARAGD